MQGLGIPLVGGGGFVLLQPVHIPLVTFPFPPDEPGFPAEPVPYGAPPDPLLPPLDEIVAVDEIMRFVALFALISMVPPAPPPPPWPP